MYKIKQIKTN